MTRTTNTSHRRLKGALLAGAMACSAMVSAQLADLAQHAHHPANSAKPHDGGMGDLDQLLHKYDERIEFIENKGQFNPAVRFKADFPLGQALATPEGMLMKAYDPAAVKARQEEGMRIEQEQHDGKPWRPLIWHERGHGWLMKFQNALPTMRVESRDVHPEVNNYFLGGREALNVHSYQEVWYTGVYRGIDVRYYPAADGSLEYDVICAPNSDPGAIAIEFKGINDLRVSAKGELVMPTSLGDMTYPAPVVYQRVGGRERRVEAQYTVRNGNILGFTLGAYDRSQPLVIDPIAMRWATWVNTNSSDDNHGHAIWVDPSDGAIYMVARVVGTTDNITVGAFDVTANGALETIVGKYLEPANIGGSGTRVWQTYIGGNGDDNPYAMEQGPDGNLYITGQTSSTNFPVLGGSAFTGASINQQAQADIDVFVLKITQDGQSIKAAIVGGNGTDDNYDVRTAPNGDVFVCGSTTSTNLSTLNAGSGASNTNNGGSDVLLFRINQDLSSLVWMRNYGGGAADRASIMLHDPVSGDLFVGGNTSSSNFPTVSPRQSTRGGTSAGFLQRLNGTTAATTWSSYFSSGTNNDANLLCMEFNTTRTELYFGGVTEGLNSANITSGSYDTGHNGSNDFYVGRMAVSDQTLLGGTYVGGSNNEVNMMGLNVDLNNDVYVFGYTNSTNFPVSASPNVPLQTTNQGENDKVFFKLESDLTALEFSTYYGGTTDDYDPVGERGIKFSNCRIYTIVTAESNNIPLTQGALNTTKLSSSSAIYEPGLVVWANPPDLLGNSITYTGTAICAGSIPGDIQGSQPSYVLPTIVRNNAASAYPSFGSAATFQWQISTDSVNWANIAGATGQNLLGTDIGPLTQKTFIRRIIGGDACILAGAADQVVTVRIMSVTGDVNDASCNGGADGSITATADGTPGFTYLWSNGQTTQTATGLAAGSYSVTVTDANGCQASNTFQVGQPSAVSGNVNTTPATCGQDNGSASVSGTGGTPGYSYVWSTGAVGSAIANVPAGVYSVTVTDANQCSVVLPVNIGGTGVPDANAGNDAAITCVNNGQVVLNGSSQTNGVSFGWSGPGIVSGGSSPSVTVNAPGFYTLTVTDPQTGCTATDQAEVELDNAVPGAQASGGTLTCTTLSVQLQGVGNGSFAWTGPNGFTSNDQNPTVSEAGTYVLTVTGANGCTSTAQTEVELDNAVPGAQAAGGTLTCTTLSVQLQGAGNGTFSWTGPNGFTSNDQNPTVSEAGTYVLTVTGANGCTSTAQTEVELDNAVPGAQAAGGTLTCTTLSVQLQGVGNGTFAWTGPNGFTSNDQNPTVSEAGTYVLTVTGANGCTSTASTEVGQDDNVPGAQAAGGTLTCTTLSVQLQGVGNGTFAWTGPNGFTSNDQNPTVSEAGTYVLTVTGANGCTSTAQTEVELDNALPGATAQGGVLNCLNAEVGIQLIGGSLTSNVTFSWTGPNGYTSNDQNPTVNVAGTYVLTVTGANGCTSTDQAEVELDNAVPGAQAAGGTLTCTTLSVQLQGVGNGTFSWTGPNGFTSNDQNPTVSEAGTYVLTVTGANGCTSTASTEVGQDDNVPGAQAAGGTLTCTTLSVQLQGVGNGTFAWTGPNGYTSNDQNPTVSEAGTYVLTVTGANGCTSTAQTEVELDNALPGATAQGGVLNCLNAEVGIQLIGGSLTSNVTFSWTGPNGYTSNDQNPTVNVAGTYVLTVTGTNGCTSTAQTEVELDNAVPGAQATGGTLTCTTLSVQLQGVGNGTFAWTGPNGFTSNDQNPTVSEAGTYVLTVTGANGCTSTASTEVGQDDNVPGAQATGGTLTCTTLSVQLQGVGNGSFAWTGPNGFTSNDQNPTVSEAGAYVLTVTGANGCTSTAQTEVELDNAVPGAQAAGGMLTCTTLSVQLQGVGNGTFSWTGPNGFTSNDQNPTVSEAGAYVLTVTGTNGCTSTAQTEVELDNAVPGAQAAGGTLTCTTLSVQLQGVGNGTFSWTGPNGFTSNDQNPTVSEAGAYVLTVTGTNGCTSTAQTEVELDNAVPGAQAAGGMLTCTTLSVQLQGVGNGTFSWTGPNGFTSNDQNPTVSEAGTYVLTVTGANGCTSTASTEVTADDDLPQAEASAGQIDCATGTAQLTGSSDQADVSFVWSGPGGFASTLQSPLVNAAGLYTLTVTGANGCSAADEVLVELPQPLTVELDAQCPSCGGAQGGIVSSVTGGSGNYSYLWSNGATTADLGAVANGTYSVVVNDAAGCSGSAVAVLACADALQIQLTGTPVNCEAPCSGSASVQLSGGQAPYTVLWSTGAAGATVEGLCEGEYTVTVFDANQCEASGTVIIGKEDCGDECPPIIIDPIFTELTVECGADVSPGALTYPVLRKDEKCPEVVLFTWTDNWSGTCPRILTRVWTFSDTEGNTEQLTQVITVVDTQGPTILNVPADVTVECGEVPQKDDGVWAEDACKSDLVVHITDAVEEGKDKCSYTIVRTYWAMDDCGNLGTATQHITVTDNTAPELTCELEAEVKATCKEIPEPAKCTAWDNCQGELGVDVVDEWITTKEGKCYIHRTYTAMDACGNAATAEQTIWLMGDCCGYADQQKVMEVSVVPNPSRDICTLSFKAVSEGRAVLSLYDVQGRPMRVLFDGMVTEGQEVRVRQEVSALDPGVYPYQLLLNGRMVHGRLMVQ